MVVASLSFSFTYRPIGAHGAQGHIHIIHFHCWSDLLDFSRSKSCVVYGLTLSSDAQTQVLLPSSPIDDVTFPSGMNAIFVIGDKNGRLYPEQLFAIDHLVFVQFPGGVELESHVLLDLKLSICLQRYSIHQLLPITEIIGEKFVLESKLSSQSMTSYCSQTPVEADSSPSDNYSSFVTIFNEYDY